MAGESHGSASEARSPQLFPMRLRIAHKLVAILIVASILVGALSLFALRNTLLPTFQMIEQSAVDAQTARARSALERLNENILAAALDYAVWDVTFDYAHSPYPEYEQEMFTVIGLNNADVDVMGVVQNDGEPIQFYALSSDRSSFDQSEAELIAALIKDSEFAGKMVSNESFGAYLQGALGLYSIQATKIRDREGKGDAPAFFMVGQRLDSQRLSEALQTDVVLDRAPPDEVREEFAKLSGNAIVEERTNSFSTLIALRGPSQELLGTIEFQTDKAISRSGEAAIQSAVIAMAFSFTGLALAIAFGVERTVVRRLSALQAYVSSMKGERKKTPQWLSNSSDEIGELALRFDNLNVELDEAEQELRQQSYVQGKADSAVGLLHNVRNAMGPLQVKYDKWMADSSSNIYSQLRLALSELDAEDTPPERRQALEKFIKLALEQVLTKSEERLVELRQVKGSIDQITGILSEYDFDSSAKLTNEPVNLASLIKKEVANQQLVERCNIHLDLPDDLPRVIANHLHLAQVIGNLLRNSVESMRAQRAEPMRLVVEWREVQGGRVAVSISDNGAGIDPQDIPKLFERGFSTKSSQSGGMGLHWSANAARAMNGKLELFSDGPGRGAQARIILPVAQPDERADILEEAA